MDSLLKKSISLKNKLSLSFSLSQILNLGESENKENVKNEILKQI